MCNKAHKELTGLWDCLGKIYQDSGFRGFFRGLSILLLRDSVPFGFYFLLFEWMRREGKRKKFESQIFVDLVCGGLAGSITWLSVMPLDVIKTCVQADLKEKGPIMKNIYRFTIINVWHIVTLIIALS